MEWETNDLTHVLGPDTQEPGKMYLNRLGPTDSGVGWEKLNMKLKYFLDVGVGGSVCLFELIEQNGCCNFEDESG